MLLVVSNSVWVNDYYFVIAGLSWIVLAFAMFQFAVLRLKEHKDKNNPWKPSYMEMSIIWTAVSVLWWFIAGGFIADRIVLVAGASILGLSSGTILGFIFTSYSEEAQSVGKVRDWILAGLATLSLAEITTGASHVKSLLSLFTDSEGTLPLGVPLASVVAFSVLGFVGSFILRELDLNPSFAKARSERKKFESALSDVPERLKIVVEGISSIKRPRRAERADASAPTQEEKDWAYRIVNLVRTSEICLEKLPKEQAAVVASGFAIANRLGTSISIYEELLERFGFDEQIIDELVGCFERLKAYESAAATLEKYRAQLSDMGVQWLGYYLLWVVPRIRESIQYSEQYLKKHPEDVYTLLNLACAYSQLFAIDGKKEDKSKTLEYLQAVWDHEKSDVTDLSKYFEWDADLFVFRDDPDFAKFAGKK